MMPPISSSFSAWRWLWRLAIVYTAMSCVQSCGALPLDSTFCRHVVFPLGYSCVEYKVTTDDGFKLVLHRISTWYVTTRTVNTITNLPMEVTPPPDTEGDIPFQGTSRTSPMEISIREPRQVSSTDTAEQPFERCTVGDSKGCQGNNLTSPREPKPSSPGHLPTNQTASRDLIPSAVSVDAPASLGPRSRFPPSISATLDVSPFPSPPATIPSAKGAPESRGEWPTAWPPSYAPAASYLSPLPSDISPSGFTTEAFDISPANSPTPWSYESGPREQIPVPFQEPGGVISPPEAQHGFVPDEPVDNPSTAAGQQQKPRRGVPVLLMHPEFLNGDSWFTPNHSPGDRFLPLMMVDAGYDVWVGHHRATIWGHQHVTFQPNQPEYWNWTWDDRAEYDLPAALNLINSETESKVHYIGVSESATVGAAAATRSTVSQMLRSLTLLGPTVYRGNTNSLVLDAWAYLFGNGIDQTYFLEGFQHGAFNYSAEFPVSTIYGQGPMAVVLDTISGPNCCLGATVIRFDNGWDGTTSFKNLLHYQQGVRSNTWQHYDYGVEWRNAMAYDGRPFPPAYNPGDIPATLPVFVVLGERDACAPAAGVRLFLSLLKGHPTSLSLPNYAHYDLTYSVNRTQDIFNPILDFLSSSDDIY
ncbi:lysosomal acid lipase/cholesteryl ester hydrolase [Marchantia polymorpha subsp. ruderalis]|nr:hypothetical protein MARPO_0084s0008 [Marchantia polymorpha]BBN12124.1 hypothetical protein Mp_5g17560 [Marchantia polymorpha subsp. ruderalis]|eukprot:PTQ33914.1 hypothetical protein MARPO_0084s0008 [Marchantia polymorpha]